MELFTRQALLRQELAQVPCSDNVVITPIQLTMAISLGKVFDIELDQSAAKAAAAGIEAAAASTLGAITAGSTTTVLNAGIIEAGKTLAEDVKGG